MKLSLIKSASLVDILLFQCLPLLRGLKVLLGTSRTTLPSCMRRALQYGSCFWSRRILVRMCMCYLGLAVKCRVSEEAFKVIVLRRCFKSRGRVIVSVVELVLLGVLDEVASHAADNVSPVYAFRQLCLEVVPVSAGEINREWVGRWWYREGIHHLLGSLQVLDGEGPVWLLVGHAVRIYALYSLRPVLTSWPAPFTTAIPLGNLNLSAP